MPETRKLDIFYARYMLSDTGGRVSAPNAEVSASSNLIKPDDDGGAVIDTNTFSGPVEVTVDVLDEEPGPADGQLWERSEDIVLTCRRGPVTVSELEGDNAFSPLMVQPGQRYHVRVSARGLRAAEEAGSVDFDDAPVEFHLVQLWPEID